MNKIKTALLLILCTLLIAALAGCSASVDPDPTESSVETTGEFAIQTETEESAAQDKSAIEVYFDRCSALSIEVGKEIRVSSDVWQKEMIGETQEKYTSLGGSVVSVVLYDTEKERIVSVSSSLSIEKYADDKLRADQIYNISVFTAAMTYGDAQAVNDYYADFESVIESGIEMYPEDLKLSLSADETAVTLIAEPTAIYD